MKKQIHMFFIVALIPILILSACGQGKLAESKLERIANPNVPASDSTQLFGGNTAFAFDLYQAVRSGTGNLVYSPYSISLALAMTYGGARGQTADQMAEVMHFTLPSEQFHPAFNLLSLNLSRRPDQVEDLAPADRFQLTIANSLWGQDGWSFLPEFLDLLSANYGAGLRLVDFKDHPDSARKQINHWVADQTKNRIKDIIPPGMPDPSTRLVLANAIYFKALWEEEFDPDVTRDGPFYPLNGEMVRVPIMSQGHEKTFSYAAGEGWQAIALPYKGGLTDMVIMVPDAGIFELFESSLTADRYAGIVSALEPQQVILSMPKFKFESSLGLKDTLIQMGMSDAFDPTQADFSGMDGKHLLYVGDVLHKAFIAVDEKGTEAAAATVVLMMEASAPQGIILEINRPFLYVIRDIPTGTILFMGRVLDPREK